METGKENKASEWLRGEVPRALRNPEVNRLLQGEGEKGFYRLVPKEGSEVDRDHGGHLVHYL